MRRSIHSLIFALIITLPAGQVFAGELGTWRANALASFGSVEDAGYGFTGILGGGIELGDIFSLELNAGMGVTEDIEDGPQRYYNLDLTLPATMTICSSKSWVCPESTFELVMIGGIGGAYFTGRWAPTVVAGVALDSYRFYGPFDIGIRVGFLGHYDVTDYERLVVMLQLNLGVIFRFGKAS